MYLSSMYTTVYTCSEKLSMQSMAQEVILKVNIECKAYVTHPDSWHQVTGPGTAATYMYLVEYDIFAYAKGRR